MRLRRLRSQAFLRRQVAEHRLDPAGLILPVFVHGHSESEPIPAMPGVSRLSTEDLLRTGARCLELNIPSIAVFPAIDPALKTPDGREALNPDGLAQRSVRALKTEFGDRLGVIADVALDPYTSHGHDGVLDEAGRVRNDESVALLVDQAVSLAEAGVDVVAPSDMMDGRIGAIRSALESAGHSDAVILSYAAKYASSFYAPFRHALGSAGALRGDKRTYQMDPANAREAEREAALDLAEGADMIMVKPGMMYLDIVRRLAERFEAPVLAYQVSGEYAMLKNAINSGALGSEAVLETLRAFFRAGARAVLTYHALEAAEAIRKL